MERPNSLSTDGAGTTENPCDPFWINFYIRYEVGMKFYFLYMTKRFEHQRYMNSKEEHEKMLNIVTCREMKVKTTRHLCIPIRIIIRISKNWK